MERTVIVYHQDCLDGFGSVFAAWKKFGDSAEYMPKKHGDPAPENLAGTHVYMIDFSYPQDVLQKLEKEAASFVVLDHHASAKEAVESIKEHVFDNDRSGATIAWNYFFPNTPTPKLLQYVQDVDIWQFRLPDSHSVIAYLSTIPFEFAFWDKLMPDMEDAQKLAEIVRLGSAYNAYFTYQCEKLLPLAQEVEFDGHRVYAINTTHPFVNVLGHKLAEKYPPFGIVWHYKDGNWAFSLRGVDKIDLGVLAKKYGGGGHKNSAAFRVPFGQPLPFTFVKK